MKRVIAILLSLSLALSMTACGKSAESAQPTSALETESTETDSVSEIPESAFEYDQTAMNKCVNDFIGKTVVVDFGTGDDGKDNFIAYSPSTILIEEIENFNEVLAADYEQGLYIIANPSEKLLKLKTDDIFVLPPGIAGAPNGVSGKIGTISLNDDSTVTIQLAAAEMQELFSYINIDTIADTSSAFYDESQLEDGMSITVSSNAPQTAVAKASGNADGHYLVDFNHSVATDISLGISKGYDLSAYANGKKSSKGFTNSYNFSTEVHITSINVQMLFNADNGYFYSDISFNWDKIEENAISFSGTWSNGSNGMGHTWPGIKGIIPGTPLMWQIEPFQLNELSGTYSGKTTYSEARIVGFCYENGTSGNKGQGYNKLLGNSHESSIELEGKLESSVGLRVKAGVPLVVNVFMDGAIGASLSGKLDIMSSEGDGEKAEIHDCYKCIDGDISVFVKGNIGIDFEIIEVVADKGLVFRFATGDVSIKIGDFYASYRDDSEINIECGKGECPYKRYKVTVHVWKEDGGPASNAFVTATYPDGRAGGGVHADNKGIAIIYLPSGDNLLEGELSGLTGTAHVIVNDKPTETSLQLTETAPILILINHYNGVTWPELEEGLKELYPAARIEYYEEPVFCSDILQLPDYKNLQDYGAVKGDIVLDISMAVPQSLSYHWEYGELYDYLHGNVYSEFHATFYRMGENGGINKCKYAFLGVQWGWDRSSSMIAEEHYSELEGWPLNWERHFINFYNTTLDKRHEYDQTEFFSVSYQPDSGIFNEYSTLNTYLYNLGNIRKAQTDYALGRTDLIMQLMIEGRDADGYIPVYPYKIVSVTGNPEGFDEEFVIEQNEYLQEQAQKRAEAETEYYDSY